MRAIEKGSSKCESRNWVLPPNPYCLEPMVIIWASGIRSSCSPESSWCQTSTRDYNNLQANKQRLLPNTIHWKSNQALPLLLDNNSAIESIIWWQLRSLLPPSFHRIPPSPSLSSFRAVSVSAQPSIFMLSAACLIYSSTGLSCACIYISISSCSPSVPLTELQSSCITGFTTCWGEAVYNLGW